MSTQLFDKQDAIALSQRIADFILSEQQSDGAIPWFRTGKLDPWDHCEAIMALSVAGQFDAAIAGLNWLQTQQLDNGAWYAAYFDQDAAPKDKIETNFVAYPATALWHLYQCQKDIDVLRTYFPMIERAIDFVLSHQRREGDIQWAQSQQEALPNDALVTACSSITRSLECAVNCADVLGHNYAHWQHAHQRLADTLKNKPWRFDRSWESKARFSMDWFYPILAGIYTEQEAQTRLKQSWSRFVVKDLGCKCVDDEPWVTVAESCELIMAIAAAGQKALAQRMFTLLLRWEDHDGGFWTGYVYRDNSIWPEEKPTWTAAAVSLAADALYGLSPAQHVFTTPSGLFFNE